ncbi:expressed unknown protein [Seminavis robusta]|uniref:Uncharacterized protein n=1 Tax=Seminavis robusta TaxID=568900 RepID=A0A9N8H047_9STRA|nr:expressed unknown protein [Seminavis robusta]|eukprot:Sro14_g010620.1 n/a (331) ;mRNA; r:96785-97777
MIGNWEGVDEEDTGGAGEEESEDNFTDADLVSSQRAYSLLNLGKVMRELTKAREAFDDYNDNNPKEQKKQHPTTVSTEAATGVARLPSWATPNVPHAAATTSATVLLEDDWEFTSSVWHLLLEDDWEFTWRVWHLLPLHERREIAHRHGYSIGTFEENMSLQQALDKDIPSSANKPYSSNQLAYNIRPDKRGWYKRKQEAQQQDGLDRDTDSQPQQSAVERISSGGLRFIRTKPTASSSNHREDEESVVVQDRPPIVDESMDNSITLHDVSNHTAAILSLGLEEANEVVMSVNDLCEDLILPGAFSVTWLNISTVDESNANLIDDTGYNE